MKPHHLLVPGKMDSAAAGCCALAIMTKAPQPGRVKTRLCPPLTPGEAAALNSCFLRDTAAAITQAAGKTRGIGCYTPAGAEEAYVGIFPGDFKLILQREGPLAERLIGAMEDLFDLGFASVCLINSDSPTVPGAVFAEAALMLNQSSSAVVLGPSDDGGYYLIGARKLEPRLFEQIDWSTSRVLEQTMERAAELSMSVHLLPSAYDVDEQQTLRRLCLDLLVSPEAARQAPATANFLKKLVAHDGAGRLGLP